MKNKLIALTPFLSLAIFFILGIQWNLWHPGWLVFLLIPLVPILLSLNSLNSLIGALPFLFVIVFVLLGDIFDLWHPTWALFLFIPALAIFQSPKPYSNVGAILSTLFIALYLVIETLFPNAFNLLLLIPLAVTIVWITRFEIVWTIDYREMKKEWLLLLLVACVPVAYVVVSFLTGLWHPLWLSFLAIPIFGIFQNQRRTKRFDITPYTPFLSVFLFVLFGELFNLYQLSWLWFLLIPIAGILEGNRAPSESR